MGLSASSCCSFSVSHVPAAPVPTGSPHPWKTAPRSVQAAPRYCIGGPFVQLSGLGVPSVSHFLLFCTEKSCHSLKQDLTFLQD